MSEKQRIAIATAGIIILAMLIFPPFEQIAKYGTYNQGYSFILSPPNEGRATVSVGLLFLQLVIVMVSAGIAWFLFKSKE